MSQNTTPLRSRIAAIKAEMGGTAAPTTLRSRIEAIKAEEKRAAQALPSGMGDVKTAEFNAPDDVARRDFDNRMAARTAQLAQIDKEAAGLSADLQANPNAGFSQVGPSGGTGGGASFMPDVRASRLQVLEQQKRDILANNERAVPMAFTPGQPNTQPMTWVGSGARAFYGGMEDVGDLPSTVAMLESADPTIEEANRYVTNRRMMVQRAQSPGAAAFNAAAGESASALGSLALTRPGAFMQGAIDQNLSSFGRQAGSIAVGALASLGGAPEVGIPMMGLGSAAGELDGALATALVQRGFDPNNAASVLAGLRDPMHGPSIRQQVLTQAGIVGAVDAVTGKAASMIPGGRTTLSRAASAAAKTAVEMIGGGGGAALGAVGSGQEINTGEVGAEMIGELIPGGAQQAAIALGRPTRAPANPPPRSNAGGVGGTARPPSPPSTPPSVTPYQAALAQQEAMIQARIDAFQKAPDNPVPAPVGGTDAADPSAVVTAGNTGERAGDGFYDEARASEFDDEDFAAGNDRGMRPRQTGTMEEEQEEPAAPAPANVQDEGGDADLNEQERDELRSLVLDWDSVDEAGGKRRDELLRRSERSILRGIADRAKDNQPFADAAAGVEGPASSDMIRESVLRSAEAVAPETRKGDVKAAARKFTKELYSSLATRMNMPPGLDTFEDAIKWAQQEQEGRANTPFGVDATPLLRQVKMIVDRLMPSNDVPEIKAPPDRPKPPEPTKTLPEPKKDEELTDDEWLAKTEFFRSGGTKNARMPDGRLVILKKESTKSNFRETSRDFLLSLRPKPKAAAKPFDRKAAIERMVQLEEDRPARRLQVVPSIELEGSDGKWRNAGGFPIGVTMTGNKRTVGYVYLSRDGTMVGNRFPTEQAAIDAQEERIKRDARDYRAGLEDLTDDFLQESLANAEERARRRGMAADIKPKDKPAPKPKDEDDGVPFGSSGVPEYGVYKVNIRNEGVRYAVRGKSTSGFGDTIFPTKAEAEAHAAETRERNAADAEAAKKEAAAKAERDAKEAKARAERENLDGFADTLTPMERGKVVARLDTQVNVRGNVATIREQVRTLIKNGGVPSTMEEPKIKPMTRTEYNRATAKEQEAHKRKMEAAGTRTVYLVDGVDLGKVAHDYATFLKERGTKAAPPAPKDDDGEGAASKAGKLRQRLKVVENDLVQIRIMVAQGGTQRISVERAREMLDDRANDRREIIAKLRALGDDETAADAPAPAKTPATKESVDVPQPGSVWSDHAHEVTVDRVEDGKVHFTYTGPGSKGSKAFQRLEYFVQDKKLKSNPTQPPALKPAAKRPSVLSVLSAEDQAEVAKIRAQIRGMIDGSRPTSGVDPALGFLAARLGSFYLKAGIKQFAVFAREMIRDGGDVLRPYLVSAYLGARRMPEVDRTGTDSADYVDSLTEAEIDAMLAEQDEAPAPEDDADADTLVDPDAILDRIKAALQGGSDRKSPEVIRLFQDLGTALQSGVRLQDAEELGGMYQMLDDGTVTLNEYTAYVVDLFRSGKIRGGGNPQGDTLPDTDNAKEDSDAEMDEEGAEPGLDESGGGKGLPGRGGSPQGESDPTGEDAPGPGGTPDGAPGSGAKVAGSGLPRGRGGRGGRSGRGGGKRGGAGKSDAQPSTDSSGGDVTPGKREADEPTGQLDPKRPTNVSDLNHRIGASDVLAPKGNMAKVKANIAMIKLLKQLEAENRNPTPAEKKVLAQYTAWGGLAPALDSVKGERWKRWLEIRDDPEVSSWRKTQEKPDADTESWSETWYEAYTEVREAMTREEFRDSQETTQYAHYTSSNVISKGIWPIVQRLGFKGGNVLEAGAGVGHMIGLMPEGMAANSKWVAVEKDAIPGRILSKLYPEATVLQQPFEQTNLKPGTFDLVVGNVPFAARGPSDKRYPKFSLHNYFMARSIDLLRPGGLMVVITSRSTMDERASEKFREWAAAQADLLGAIRLPNSAFMENAGTKVTTDLLVFRKRDGASMTLGKEFATLQDVPAKNTTTGEDTTTPINEYFKERPQMMLGEIVVGRGLYSDQEPMLVAPKGADIGKMLGDAIDQLPTDVAIEGSREAVKVERGIEGMIGLDESGRPYQVVGGERKGFTGMSAKVAASFVAVRGVTVDLYAAQIDPKATSAAIEKLRAEVRKQYQAFTAEHGKLNKQGKVLSSDPDFYRVAALELGTRTVKKTEVRGKTKYVFEYSYTDSDVLTKRTQFPAVEPTTAENIEDAVAISESWKGSVDIGYIASLLNETTDQIKREMLEKGLAFIDPQTGQMVPAEEYLSGHLRKKMEAAEATKDPMYEPNIAALKAAMPARVSLPGVTFSLGAQWVPPKVYKAFADDYLGTENVLRIQTAPEAADRQLVASPGRGAGSNKDTEMGAGGMDASEIIAKLINLQPIRVMMEVANPQNKSGVSVVIDPERTPAAKFKGTQIDQAFQSWAKGSEFAVELEDLYNETFNSSAVRKWKIPTIERFPGASPLIKLLPHQRRAVYRGLRESYLNANEVGTGKTFIMISTAMEMRRLGLARKPLIVVQNSTMGQIADSFARLYPSARVLVPTQKDLETVNRKRLINLIASNDWDAVILPQSQFNMIPDRPERVKDFVMDQIDELEEAIIDAGGTPGKTGFSQDPKVKALGKRLAALREFFDKLMARKLETQAGTFEDMGIDGLLVDEAHAYKKLAFVTNLDNIKGLDTAFSQRGLTMLMKSRWVQGRRGGKNVVLFTGTPITNTLAEAWTMARYVRPDLLEANDIAGFDRFVTAFAIRSTEYETVAGVKLKEVERLRQFANVPEFQRLWLQIADEVRADDVGIKRPPIKGGGRQLQMINPSKPLKDYAMQQLARYEEFEGMIGKERYENRHIPGQVNGLMRAAAVDLRLVQGNAPDDPNSKLNVMARNIFKIWKETEDQRLTQAVFIDRFQRADGSFNANNELRNKLIELGVPRDEIGVLTDSQYDDPDKRGPIFEAVNNREVRIAIGTTDRMGVGVNIQKYLVALHHGDVPARPSDIEQREGRINRQGNLVHEDFGIEPEIVAYGVKGMDGGAYDRLSRKQKMQDDARSGKYVGRVIDDDADDVAGFADFAAELMDDPDFKKRAVLQSKVRELEAANESHQALLINARRRITQYEGEYIPGMEKTIADMTEVREAAAGFEKAPVLTLRSTTYEGEKAIIEALKTYMEDAGAATESRREDSETSMLVLKGANIYAAGVTFGTEVTSYKSQRKDQADVPAEITFKTKHDTLYGGGWSGVTTADGIYGRILVALADVPDVISRTTGKLAEARIELDRSKEFIKTKFSAEAELIKAREDLNAVVQRIVAKSNAAASRGAPESVGAKVRSSSRLGDMLERFGETLSRIERNAQARVDAFNRRGPQLYSNPMGDPALIRFTLDNAVIVIAKALRAKVRGGKKLTAIVNQVVADAKARKGVTLDAGAIRRAAVRAFKKGVTEENFEAVADGMLTPMRTKSQAKRDKRAAAQARAAAVAGITNPPDTSGPVTLPSAKEALKTKLKGEEKTADRVAKQAVSEIKKVMGGVFNRAKRRYYREGMEFVREAMNKRRRNREAIDEIERRGLIEYAKTLPPEVRGKLVSSISAASTPGQYMRAMRMLEREALRYQGRLDLRWIRKNTSPKKIDKAKGMTDALRKQIRQARAKAMLLSSQLRAKGAETAAMKRAGYELRLLRNAIATAIKTARAEYAQMKEVRRLTAVKAGMEIAENVRTANADKTDPDDIRDVEVGAIRRLARGLRDIRNIAQRIEGKAGGLLEKVLWENFEEPEDAMFARARDARAMGERAFKRAGFDSLAEAQRLTSGRAGEGNTKKITVTIGGKKKTISLGDLIDILGHSSDPMTAELIASDKGQLFQGAQGRFRQGVEITPAEIDAIRAEHDPDGKYTRLVEDIKAVFETLKPDAFAVHMRMKGFEPEDVAGRWPRARNVDAVAELAKLPETAGDMVHRFLENDGMFETRKQTTGVPIVLQDPVTMMLDQIDRSVRTIYLAEPTRDAANILFQPEVREAVASRFGPATYTMLKHHVMMMSRADRVLGTRTARAVSVLNSAAAVANLGLNPGTWAVTLVSAIRLLPIMGPAAFMAGVKGIKSVSMEKLISSSGYAYDRYEGHHAADRFSAVVSGGPTTTSENRTMAELGAAGRNLMALDLNAAGQSLRNAAQTSMGILNWFDGLVMRIAWAGYEAQSKKDHPDWTPAERTKWVAKQARRAMRETQNGSSPVDMAIGPASVRDSGASAFTLFSSDVFKTRNRLERALRKGYKDFAAAAAAELTSIVIGLAFRRALWLGVAGAFAAGFGMDDEDEERLLEKYTDPGALGIDLMSEISGIVLPILGKSIFDLAAGPAWRDKRVLEAPAMSMVDDTFASVVRAVGAVKRYLEDDVSAERAVIEIAQLLNQGAAIGGINPFMPILRRFLTEWSEAEKQAN